MKAKNIPIKTLAAIIAITILEGLAIWQGINGWLLGFAIAAIAGLGGYEIGYHRKRK